MLSPSAVLPTSSPHSPTRIRTTFLRKLIGPPRRIDPATDEAEYENYSQSLATHPIDTGRIVAVLDKVAEMSDWGRTLPDGHGLGIAVHRSFLTTVGTVAASQS